MRIVVCVKQVPVMAAMQIDPTTKTLRREGVPVEVSAFDVRALLKAVEMVDLHGGEVVALTMGPPQARQALDDCLALGAHRAVHLCDRAFAGSDTLATARALAAAIARERADLILCGRHSVDAETGQVGPEVAELLGLAQITVARTLEVDPSLRRVTAERETDDGFETVEATLPVVVTAAEDLAPERFPSKAERQQAKEKSVTTVTAVELGLDAAGLGSKGSPTWVAGLEIVDSKRAGQVLDGTAPEQAVEELVRVLLEKGLFGEWKLEAREERHRGAAVARSGPKDVWVVAEALGGRLRPVTHELLGKGAELAERLGGTLTAILLGSGIASLTDELAAHRARRVLLAEDERLGTSNTDLVTAILAEAIRARQPGIVLLPSTTLGRDVAPRVAARLGLGLTGDCIDLDLDDQGRLVQYKPAFGGSVVAPILSKTWPEMATLRPGMLAAASPESGRSAVVEQWPVAHAAPVRVRVVDRRTSAETATVLDNATVVIGVGKGVGGKENLSVIESLAQVLGAGICATRDVTDEGWLPKQYQVGLTGRTVAPKLYVAVGIRGALEHMVGVRRAGLIVAINKNTKAPVFKNADYGIVGDYAQLVPMLVERLRAVRGS
jgi:electron transfer flavoprotein alpha subunit